MSVGFRFIQPCPFGQAYVRFNFFHDRDRLIHSSPHQSDDVSISYVEHDKCWNHKRVTMNHEVWLMFLGYNVDHWTTRMVDKALYDWGSLITWEKDHNFVARILVKAKVVSLHEIPWFIYCSENDDFEGDTWVVQCEVLQTSLLGAQPVDEDDPPNDQDNLNPDVFDFFGYGQPGQGPVFGPPPNPDIGPQVDGWGLWPQPQNQHAQQEQQLMNQQILGNEGVLADGALIEQNVLLQGEVADFDLNVPMQEELGELDELPDLIPVPVPNQEEAPIQEDIIEASSASSASSEANAPAPLDLNLEPVEVNVFIPMDEDGMQLQINPDEIPEDQLLGADQMDDPASDDSENPMNVDEVQSTDQIMHLGFVEICSPNIDPVFEHMAPTGSSSKNSDLPADLYRFWAKYFAPRTDSLPVSLSPDWAAFFTAALMNPGSFAWAKSFLASPAWALLANSPAAKLPFALPAACPVKESHSCLSGNVEKTISVVEELMTADSTEDEPALQNEVASPTSEFAVDLNKVSPSTGPWAKSLLRKARKLKITEDDPSIRRSARQRDQNKGFKHKSCQDRHCLICEAPPPNISPSIIRNLGATFCDIDPNQLTDAALAKKKKVSTPGKGKKTVKKNLKPKVDDDVSKKKAKKH